MTTFHGTTDQPGAVRDANPVTYGRLKNSILPFLLTLAPFALVATFLLILTMVLPGLSPFGTNGPAGSLAMPLMAIVLCAIGTVLALFLVRISTIFLLRHRKARGRQPRCRVCRSCRRLLPGFHRGLHLFLPYLFTRSASRVAGIRCTRRNRYIQFLSLIRKRRALRSQWNSSG